MKVLMLNGSFNPDGSTKAGLDIMAGTFAEEGVETEIVTVGGKPIADCIACGKCAELKRCVFANDGVNDFAEKAKTADGFVFGTPVYYAHPTGRVLSFLDRLFFSRRLANGYAHLLYSDAAGYWYLRFGDVLRNRLLFLLIGALIFGFAILLSKQTRLYNVKR